MSKGLVFSVIAGVIILASGFIYFGGRNKFSPETNIATGATVSHVPPVTPQETASNSIAGSSKDTKTTKSQLLFFMNPNGQPCQIQDQALITVRSEIEKYAEIVYFKTTNPADEEKFYQYGIRSLPSLIILNAKNEEIKRFPPGIQDSKEIIAALQELK